MKAIYYFTAIAILTLTLDSCSSGRYVAREYDDLYFIASDQQAVSVVVTEAGRIPEGTLRAEEYYDNIYAADTLVSEEYSDAVDYDDALIYNYDDRGRQYDYYGGNYYSGRLSRFYGNYFNPYWRDPFYYGFGFSPFSYSFGYRGFPSYYGFYDPFYYDSFYYPYSSYYSGYYGGFYSPYYYSPYYSPNYWGGYPYYSFRDEINSVPYGRRERASNLSTRWTGGDATPTSSTRRDPYISTQTGRSTSGQAVATDSRRTVTATNPVDRSIPQDQIRTGTQNATAAPDRRSTVTRPEYNQVDRTYTPSYNNPRMSTRPSYNNSRINQSVNPAINNSRTNVNQGRTIINQNTDTRSRTNSSISTGQSRTGGTSSSGSYTVPARRSVESGSLNSGRSSSGFSSGSVSRSIGSSSGSSSISSSSGGGVSRSSGSSSSSSSSGGTRR